MMKEYLTVLILLTIFVLSGLALTTNDNVNDETAHKIHLQNVIADHVSSVYNLKQNRKLHFSRRRREDLEVNKFLSANEAIQHWLLEKYSSKRDSHTGGSKKPSIDFDAVIEETIPFNSTDYAA
uniref:Uncharacterized protein n=1 Tax=Panagrolaimus sp. PS1159 TaxID=55785 RepID=A0AC35EST3_9BILA